MIIELEPIFNNEGLSKDISYSLDLSDAAIGNDRPFTSPVSVSGRVYNNAEVVHLELHADLILSVSCDRCAVPMQMPFSVPVDHVLVTQLNDEENDELILVDNLSYNLDPLVTEDIFLELPSKFLCSRECKGICSICGKNLNEGPCSCEKPIDPRLEALKQLLDN